jgi:transposase
LRRIPAMSGLLQRFAQLREKARVRTGKVFPLIVIQEAGLDGFWIDRVLKNEEVESHVVDPASIATSRCYIKTETLCRRLAEDGRASSISPIWNATTLGRSPNIQCCGRSRPTAPITRGAK